MLMDGYLLHIMDLIEEHGWAVQGVGAGASVAEPSFSYTVGLTVLGHPEFIVVGMPPRYAQQLLNALGSEVRKGIRYVANTMTVDATDASAPAALIAVDDPSKLLVAVELYGEIEALQIVWPDPQGRLPWDEGYPNPAWAQPFLGPVPDRFDA